MPGRARQWDHHKPAAPFSGKPYQLAPIWDNILSLVLQDVHEAVRCGSSVHHAMVEKVDGTNVTQDRDLVG